MAIIDLAVVLPFLPESLKQSGWAVAIRGAFIALLLLLPALIVVRETQRAGIRGTAVQLSERQYPQLYQTVEGFARAIGLRRRPDIFLANGNGTLNAFAAQATGHDYVVLANELFANLYNGNRNGLRFIIGHELGHIRFHHVALWYQLAVAYSQRIPLLGPTLSRLREYSCDRQGAALTPQGATGLVLLASGRYTENAVDVNELLGQGRGCTASGWDSPSCRGRIRSPCGAWNVSTGWACSSPWYRPRSMRTPSAARTWPVHEHA